MFQISIFKMVFEWIGVVCWTDVGTYRFFFESRVFRWAGGKPADCETSWCWWQEGPLSLVVVDGKVYNNIS